MISFTMAKIFPMEVVHLLIEAVFNEMRTMDLRIRGLTPEREKSDAQRHWYVSGTRMIEYIKKFLSRYLVGCSQNKYDVLQYIMYGVTFLGKEMRASFTEEILEGAKQLLVSRQ